MSKNHTKKNHNRNERRLKEIERAQIKQAQAASVVFNPRSDINSSIQVVTKPKKTEERFTLPIKDIKKDLVKNTFYALFSIILLLVLKTTGFGADYFAKFFKF